MHIEPFASSISWYEVAVGDEGVVAVDYREATILTDQAEIDRVPTGSVFGLVSEWWDISDEGLAPRASTSQGIISQNELAQAAQAPGSFGPAPTVTSNR